MPSDIRSFFGGRGGQVSSQEPAAEIVSVCILCLLHIDLILLIMASLQPLSPCTTFRCKSEYYCALLSLHPLLFWFFLLSLSRLPRYALVQRFHLNMSDGHLQSKVTRSKGRGRARRIQKIMFT